MSTYFAEHLQRLLLNKLVKIYTPNTLTHTRTQNEENENITKMKSAKILAECCCFFIFFPNILHRVTD